jgi:hypothetical protein
LYELAWVLQDNQKMTFEEYLVKKRINKAAFAAGDPARFAAWADMYAQMHQNSFNIATKMVINDVRLRYHLKEEDIPKAVPASATSRPVMRRAAPAAEGTTTSQAPVPQETSEDTPKPRPVVKRPTITKPTVAEGETIKPEEAKPTESAKPRPVIKRPVISKPIGETPESKPLSEDTALTRPRPVIKRPAALQKPDAKEVEADKNADSTITPEATKPAVRPRPVIKRPAALQKPTVEKPTEAEITNETIKPTETIVESEAAKPARPRPVIKRPAALQKPAAEERKPEEAKPEEQPIINITEEPAPATKPARPRPVIKRPTPAVSEETTADAKPSKVAQSTTDEQRPQQTEAEAGEAIKPKPPRPRPVIKRPPPKPDTEL